MKRYHIDDLGLVQRSSRGPWVSFAEVEQLEAELAWCHEALGRALRECDPGIPAPDWHTVYRAIVSAVDSDGCTIDTILEELEP